MKPIFDMMCGRGVRSAELTAVFAGMDHRGHAVLKDVTSKYGIEDHAWLNNRYMSIFSAIKKGDRIRFWADLLPFKKSDGSRSIRLECPREVHIL